MIKDLIIRLIGVLFAYAILANWLGMMNKTPQPVSLPSPQATPLNYQQAERNWMNDTKPTFDAQQAKQRAYDQQWQEDRDAMQRR